ncbi:MAG: hypothetical protein MHPSP_003918, partial [Paramarteilia canceri]
QKQGVQNLRREIKVISRSSLQDQINDYFKIIDAAQFDLERNAGDFWLQNYMRFSKISDYALQILAIPPTSASAERLFSICGNLSYGRKSSVKSNSLKKDLY